jgi:DNA-binding HxlR family transcriptional regulator
MRRWCLPILAAMHEREGGARFVVLANLLDANQAAVRASLDRLVGLRLVTPNPGYGHPLRPEYVLTPAGERAGAWASRLRQAVAQAGGGAAESLRGRWSLPTLTGVGQLGSARFGELAHRLPSVTDRALSLTLKGLQAAELVRRRVESQGPVAVHYEPGPRAAPIVPILASMPPMARG